MNKMKILRQTYQVIVEVGVANKKINLNNNNNQDHKIQNHNQNKKCLEVMGLIH